MNINIKFFSLLLVLIAGFSASPAFAGECNDTKDNDGDAKIDYPADTNCASADGASESATGYTTPPGSDDGAVDLGFKLDNPLNSEVDTLPEFLNEIIHIFLVFGVPIVALAIIYCGFLFVIARGNSEKLTEAKKALGYTLLGAAILLGAFVISNLIQGTVDNIQDATVMRDTFLKYF